MKDRADLILELAEIQNELSAYTPVDIMTITGFMKTNEEVEDHIKSSAEKLEAYKSSRLQKET
tara:strand:- start:1668 stop:1856 length:189 start_codon:yes stop_codon:yes gene_type:complete